MGGGGYCIVEVCVPSHVRYGRPVARMLQGFAHGCVSSSVFCAARPTTSPIGIAHSRHHKIEAATSSTDSRGEKRDAEGGGYHRSRYAARGTTNQPGSPRESYTYMPWRVVAYIPTQQGYGVPDVFRRGLQPSYFKYLTP